MLPTSPIRTATGTPPVSCQFARAAIESWPVAGQSDIARALGISRQRVGQLRQLDGFPGPVQTVNGAPVWVLGEVQDWYARRRQS